MAFFRPTTTYLLLATMLLSNVVGWVHVGCCHHSPEKQVANDGSEVSGVSCCHHCNCHGSDKSKEASSENTAAESDPWQGSTPHDSDSCNVCQSLFAFRYSILISTPVVVLEPLVISNGRPELDEVSFEPIFLSGLSVRGPPNV